MVRPHGDGASAALLHEQERLHQGVHVHVALQVVRLVEVARGVAPCAAQVHEVDAVAKAFHHAGEVVVRPHAEGAGAEAQPVALVRHRLDEAPEILLRAHDAGQTQDGVGRVVGMDDEPHARLVRHGADRPQEFDEVRAEPLGVHVLVALQRLAELVEREALLGPGQSGYHVARQPSPLLLAHRLVACPRDGLLRVGVLVSGRGPSQDEEVERHVGRALEAQCPRAVRHRVGEVGAGPVQHRHEVVRHDADAACPEVSDALFIILDVRLEIAFARLDMLVHGHALHDAPPQPGGFYRRFSSLDFLDGPHLAVGDVVQGGHDTGRSRLADVLQADGVVGPVPAPCLLTQKHFYS